MKTSSKNHAPSFGIKTLTQAVTLGLILIGGEAAANTAGTGGVGSTSMSSANTTRSSADGTTFQTIGDLEIYQAAKAGGAGLMMMLDLSGSMTDILSDFPEAQTTCQIGKRKKTHYLTDSTNTIIQSFTKEDGTVVDTSKGLTVAYLGCDSNFEQLTRLDRMKKALIETVADSKNIPDVYRIGVGVFPLHITGGNIAIPAKPLTPEHRWNIMRYAAGLQAGGNTPSAHAYAEAGAYMMGTKTANLRASPKNVMSYTTLADIKFTNPHWELVMCDMTRAPSFDSASNKYLANCNAPQPDNPYKFGYDMPDGKWILDARNNTPLKSTNFADLDFSMAGNGDYLFSPNFKNGTGLIKLTDGKNPGEILSQFRDPTLAGSGVKLVRENKVSYVESGEYQFSGFGFSSHTTKKVDGESYQSPVGDQACDGYGIYFLTDGEPNGGQSVAQGAVAGRLMANSLNKPTTSVVQIRRDLNVDSSGMSDGGARYRNSGSGEPNWDYIGAYAKLLNSTNNPVGKQIKTATVGFGSSFTGVATTKRTVVVDGESKEIDEVVCDQLNPANNRRFTTTDAYNLCRLGSKAESYGQGGFTATSDSTEVKNSIIRFARDLQQTISSQPAGTISVPKDPLSVTNIQPYAYLPMIEPKVTSDQAVWRGNLKKYHTLNGTLYGKDGTTRLYVKAKNATNQNTNYPSQFNTAAADIWQTANSQGDNALIDVGGTKEHIQDIRKASDNGARNSRSVYLENYKSFDMTRYNANKAGYMRTVESEKELVKVSIENGQLKGFDKLKAPYNLDDIIHIIAYLGVDLSKHKPTSQNQRDLQRAVSAAITAGQMTDRVLGGVVHSVPVLASFRGEFEEETEANKKTGVRISSNESKRDDTLLYGSMDGALHMVEAQSGKERFAFIPRAIFEDTEQRNALQLNGTNQSRVGNPVFGMDAPWTVHADYVYEFANESGQPKNPATVRAKTMYAYGGMRMGGNGIFGLDITNMRASIGGDVAKNANPELLFSINRYTPGFERLGQTWSKPLVAKIKTGEGSRDLKDVLIFGGGYDMCYEHPKFRVGLAESTHMLTSLDSANQTTQYSQYLNGETSCAKDEARGNAVYMVDAKTGDFIATWQTPDMKDSIVGEITALDRNNNGAIDHLYFADLGGKVFRVDLKEGVTPSGRIDGTAGNRTPSDTAITRRVVKVLDANEAKKDDPNHIYYRFYDQPLVSFYDHVDNVAGSPTLGKKVSFAVVNIASGDRSSPVHQHRNANNANLIFGIFDRDLTSTKLDRAATDPGLVSKDLTTANLELIDPKTIDLDPAPVATPNANGVVTGTANKAALEYLDKLKAAVMSKTKTNSEGWYYSMHRFDGLTQISGLKSMGTGLVTGNVYYANIYSPSYEYTTTDSCSARVSGGTERQLYCLPWGICATENGAVTTANGVLGFLKAGPGIQELAIGTVTNSPNASSAFRAILGHQMLSEIAGADRNDRAKVDGGDNSAFSRLPSTTRPMGGDNEGGDVYGPNIITSPQYTLAVQRWYDLQNEKQN